MTFSFAKLVAMMLVNYGALGVGRKNGPMLPISLKSPLCSSLSGRNAAMGDFI
jgi:hypothetical protein